MTNTKSWVISVLSNTFFLFSMISLFLLLTGLMREITIQSNAGSYNTLNIITLLSWPYNKVKRAINHYNERQTKNSIQQKISVEKCIPVFFNCSPQSPSVH